MEKKEFLLRLKEELEFECDLDLATNFNALDEWDSMSAMVLIGFVSENFGVTLTGDKLKGINSFEELVNFIGIDKFD